MIGSAKKYGAAIVTFLFLFGGVFFLQPQEAQAAEACCVYTVMPASKPPEWLTALGKGSNYFFTGADGKPCAAASEIVPIGLKKIDKYYDNNGGDTIAGICEKTNDYAEFAAAVKNTSCCEVITDAGALRGCFQIPKTTQSDIERSCIYVTTKLFQPGDKIISHNTDCTAVTSCQELQKKIDTQVAANQEANAMVAAQTTAKEAGKRPIWTKDDCLAIKQSTNSAESKYVWAPPKSNPNATFGDHCYIKQLPTNLQVNIGQTSVIKGLPSYINILYKYALGFGVLLMIVVIVFSGIQWMLSGVASSINDSKDRIKNASLGLLLLFGANTILYTINPQLLNLQLPLMHAIRPETFEVAAPTGVRCDPGDKNACSDKGPNFKCKPTEYYVGEKCLKDANGFMALTFGGAALAAAGPFALSALGSGSVFEAGAGQTVKKIATEVVENAAVDAATDTKTSASGNIAESLISATSKKGKMIIGGIAVLTGLIVADNLYADAQAASGPALGFCVEMTHSLPDFSVCQADGDCASNKCLVTSKAACGAGDFGVCVSGQLRQACAIPSLYGKIFGDADATKYGCANGIKCVDNGRGAALDGIGVCSDGSDIGMACDSDVQCDTKIKNLSCVKGYCREAASISNKYGSTGLWFDFDGAQSHPRCLMPTDCNDASIGIFGDLQGTIMTGCLKNPSPELKLPARLLISQQNQPISPSFYAELSTYGRCVTDLPYWKVYKDKTDPKSSVQQKLPFACFVNIYSSSSFTSANKAIADFLNGKNYGLTGKYAQGFKMQKVGCSCSKASSNGYGNNVCHSDVGACVIDASALINAQTTFANNSFISVQGSCEDAVPSKGAAYVDPATEKIHVFEQDEWNNGVRFPNIVDLQYTNAGKAVGS